MRRERGRLTWNRWRWSLVAGFTLSLTAPLLPSLPPLRAVTFKTEITVSVAWFLWWRHLEFGFGEQEVSVSRNYPTPRSSRQIRKYHYRLELAWIRTTLIGLAICGTLPENKIASGSRQSERRNYPRMSDNLSSATLSVRPRSACQCCNTGFLCWHHLEKQSWAVEP